MGKLSIDQQMDEYKAKVFLEGLRSIGICARLENKARHTRTSRKRRSVAVEPFLRERPERVRQQTSLVAKDRARATNQVRRHTSDNREP
jgi:hypothetical protein